MNRLLEGPRGMLSATVVCLACVLPVLVCAEQGATAGASSNGTIRDKNGACAAEAARRSSGPAAPVATLAFTHGKVQHDRAHYISPTEAQGLRDTGQAVLVDVRRPEAFASFSIPGSINIPATAVPTKGFLRNKAIILVDRGYAEAGLDALRDRLARKGFGKVAVLDGGLNAWRRAFGPLPGDESAQRRLDRITPRELHPLRQYGDWAVLDVSAVAMPDPGASPRQRSEHLQAGLATLREAQAPDAARLVMVTATGKGYPAITAAVTELGWEHVYYLTGGRRAYDEYLVWRAALKRPGRVAIGCRGRS